MRKTVLVILAVTLSVLVSAQPRDRQLFNAGWTFEKDGVSRVLDLPHDWGVEGPFVQAYPGETGKLAWWGKATYRKHFTVSAEDLLKDIALEIDGAMSGALVTVNGVEVGAHPYGYASFAVDLTPALREGDNEIAVALDNPEESSRWYPGGGIYRNVWLIRTEKTSVAHWGTYVTTRVREGKADIALQLTLKSDTTFVGMVTTRILRGRVALAETRSLEKIYDGKTFTQTFELENPALWSPEHPEHMYWARTVVEGPDGQRDTYETHFGVRTAEWKQDGFYLNGEKCFLKGVCLHHDAGALGAVWNETAWVRRLCMLKEMGCNAIRCSHNPPAPELLDLCDRMGFLVIDELTDTWTVPKKENGYARLFDQWAEQDLVDMIRRDRNHPSVILWSIGNECGEQGMAEKWEIPSRLTDICHREDPTRPTTAGNDNLWAASQPYAATIDVYGFNYKPHAYATFRDTHPDQPFFGSETASCISTRGYYRFPVPEAKGEGWAMDAPFQVSSYDLYAPGWASSPDYEWFYEDEVLECAGEFVWTGYDYLGEPTPFNLDPSVLTNFHTEEEKQAYRKMLASWGQEISEVPLPSRSSYFGIMDLAGFPKDRYWLYQARWRADLPMAHILPHWTWPGREGQVTPVHVYSSGDRAELFVNGVSQGVRTRGTQEYRFRWDEVVYVPGTVRVVVWKDGQAWAEDEVRTAGKAARLSARVEDIPGPADLIYVDIDILDKEGTLVPDADNLLTFHVKGPVEVVAADAGDPTSHIPFYSHELPAFHGRASVILRRKGKGAATLSVSTPGLKKQKIHLPE